MEEKVKNIITMVLNNANQTVPEAIDAGDHLRDHLGLDSLMLAELTVHIEEEFGIDVFEDGIINTVDEIYAKLR